MENEIFNLLQEVNEIQLREKKYFYNGIAVPRVTDIISKMISEEYLLYWANSLGFKHQSYKKTVDEAARLGSEAHDLINKFILGENFNSNNIPYLSFRKWWTDINSNCTVKIIGTEQSITCQYFGGTYDLLIEVNDKLYLVDFKTSNHISYKHFIQLSAYKYMLEQQGYIIDGCIILQLDKKEILYNEYSIICWNNIEHKNFIDDCQNTFFSLVYAYYNIFNCQNIYNEIF